MMTYSIQFGSKKIDFQLQYSNRKTLGISVNSAMEVRVKAPNGSAIEKVKELVRKKSPWIIKQQTLFLGFYPKTPARRFVSGETHLYMGRQYKLKVIKTKKNGIHFNAREIKVNVKPGSTVKQVLHAWYRERAKLKFAEIAEPLIQQFKKYKVEPSSLHLQEMPYRWGSCTSKGRIILNPELIKAPKACVEYVIIHELCHLLHKNHTKQFFKLQSKEMPDWEKWKGKLELLLA